jgi:hypothetical protein
MRGAHQGGRDRCSAGCWFLHRCSPREAPEGILAPGPRNQKPLYERRFDLKRFLGKTALVTGASRGIGAAVARMLSERGADVVINFRSKEFRAAQVAAQVESLGRRALLAPADLTDAGSVAAMARAVQIVSGDMIEGTITPKLLERASRGLIESRRGQAGVLPTVEEFAAAIVDAAAAAHSPHGHVFFVGCID